MTHITIPTNSESLYTYIDPYIYHLDSIESESIVNNVKVFVNGCWIGMAKDPVELYREMKIRSTGAL